MNKKTMATLMALSMLAMAFAFAPSATAYPCQDDTNGDGKKDTGDKDDCDYYLQVFGPTSITYKPLFLVGVGFCHDVDPTLALACNNTGGVQGAGAFAIPTTPKCDNKINCVYNVWVKQAAGAGNGGFGVAVCNDRNDDGVCTNGGSDFDDFGHNGYTEGTTVAGGSKEGNKVGFAYTTFCVRPDYAPVGAYDEFWGFIFAWVDESVVFGDNTGVGVSTGTYDVWADYKTSNVSAGECLALIDDPAS